MLGLNDKSWLIEKFYEIHHASFSSCPYEGSEKLFTYDTYFGMGHSLKLIDDPSVFKVSPAGLALGSYTQKMFSNNVLNGHFLDLGTGSGVIALLLRGMGADHIIGTDISPAAVSLSVKNETLNFGNNKIAFVVSDLFSGLPNENQKFDFITFNPPGWRTPSEKLLEYLMSTTEVNEIPLSAMFYGDTLLLRFLQELPTYLNKGGRAIIGLNSLVGIQDILSRYKNEKYQDRRLKFRFLERHTFPLLLYSESWKRISSRLMEEFSSWRDKNQAAYSVDSKGNLYWSYELVECVLW
ncbi:MULTISPECIES: methyltransferase [unclassified Undibacterium]|uniref:methyltransferase n=1 Tax=unclassified Undibacterium TaxID=2630295 RepID=UPI002AC94325|nr:MULTISPECIES: methyltransferase [unclassified Undibacterium]MEB0139097.1 methyltransferase domain-containing protein [Undibacterium sp. CCC2.1]MEB0174206.1 methyltransferase domain-containing protein [Undibacterium sp. CCC1.1]MEB0177172.1 methyltransferase domain-containing protein [Undibacterium sp. CCC3.4]MEB0216437.1 methyltransferase domain-containing protein [Undibacterium sp. 5I2]WPX42067.1 methyltransferase domain-containing protein [Undibacterium sp. CCC3.4]